MGPKKAEEAVRSAIALGCDKGYLLTDRKFAGSDTWVTAYALATGIKKILGTFDIILCGERATDGETGQVGPEVGAYLGLPVLTYVSKIEEIGAEKIVAHRAVEGGHEVVEAPLPVLISVIKEINTPRMPNFSGKMKAKKAEIPLMTADDIGADEERLGLKGSQPGWLRFSSSGSQKGKDRFFGRRSGGGHRRPGGFSGGESANLT